ncbi:MAG TPA: tRNA preQ1(34) S-adenosylmethionine ribosyltransferase-isomerase QueA [Armatimonadetes bacterium]|nr:tRNA preQ1(34) S-adenosylmethionine ribosyltransferase-isomerase QueA [Armatimonadota bacterium]
MNVSDYDYDLPPESIARYPAERRDLSRLLVLDRVSGEVAHRTFRDILELLEPGDLLALNDTRVIPARLIGRAPGGAVVELLLLEPVDGSVWRAIGRPGRRLREGCSIDFGDGVLQATVREVEEDGGRLIELRHEGELLEALDQVGEPPLPPYIGRAAEPLDRERYQTVYAREPGAVAAPTAGLHFTKELLGEVAERGVEIGYVTLHVGVGTFRPVRVERIEDHEMHSEYYEVSEEFARQANTRTGRLVAVGTTVTRTLESSAGEAGQILPGRGRTELFIYPGYRFRAVQAMVTNFHLPRSTLLMMIAAFAGGRERAMAAYQEALERGYRFYSYGDAMMIR